MPIAGTSRFMFGLTQEGPQARMGRDGPLADVSTVLTRLHEWRVADIVAQYVGCECRCIPISESETLAR